MTDDVLRKFAKLGEKSFEKLTNIAFKNFSVHFKSSFLELAMDDILSKIFNYLIETTSCLHEMFARKVWRMCFERVVLMYTQSLLSLGQNVKFKQVKDVIDKLAREKATLQDAFKGFVDSTQISNLIKIIDDYQAFLEVSGDLIPMGALTLKKAHGTGLNVTTLKLLMNLRIDISKSERNSILEECKQVSNFDSDCL